MTARGISEAPSSRIQALQYKYSIINSQIEEALKSPSAADFYISQLKKQRLVLKEKIEDGRKRKSVS